MAENLTGWNQPEALDKPITEIFKIINEKTGKPHTNPIEQALSTKQIVKSVDLLMFVNKKNGHFSIEYSVAPLFNSGRKIRGSVVVFRDITEEKRIKEELLRAKKIESVGVLAGGIAHDFNNILAVVIGNINLAKPTIEKESDAYILLDDAEKASSRAANLTQQLLTFSKGGQPIKETTSIGEVIADSANFVLHGSAVALHFDIPEDLWLVDIDKGQMSQVIQNIVLNARYDMAEGGDIHIDCANIPDIRTETGLSASSGKHIKIMIRDSGSGIPEKYIDKIFDPYFSTKPEGSGLGLAVSHSIIKKHSGHVSVKTAIGEGTTFTLYLPVSDCQSVQKRKRSDSDSKNSHQKRVLVMDDEPMIHDLFKQMLSRLGHEVLQARDGKEAVEIFKSHRTSGKPVDLVIMDLTIPGGMGGKVAVQEIRKIDPDAKSIVSSGYSDDPVMTNYQKYGFKAAIRKPFRIADLNAAIDSVFGK
jgi:PAS domain S-box-containing protein